MNRIGSGSLSGNSILNFSTQAFVMILAFVCTPLLIARLGNEEFGLLSLLWMFIWYFGFLDLGVGQAAIKFVSEGVGNRNFGNAAAMLRSALILNLVIGLSSSVIVVLFACVGVEKVVNITPSLQKEANLSLLMLSAGVPLVLIQATLRSVPLAFNRFDLVNGVQATIGVLQWAGSAAVLLLGGGLLTVVVLTVVTRFVAVVLLCIITLRYLPGAIRRSPGVKKPMLAQLIGFGGWVTVSQVAAPLMTLTERLVIGGIVSVTWLTYFAVPNDAVVRLLVIPMSVVNVLFPFVSSVWVKAGGKERAKELYQRSVKYIFLLTLPIVLVLVIFGHDILALWVGNDIAEKSAAVFGILSFGFLFNALAQIPNATLQALGRPDLPARLVLLELPCYALLCYVLTSMFGIVGTAGAWLLRVVIEAGFLLYLGGRQMRGVVSHNDLAYVWKSPLILLLGALLLVGTRVVVPSALVQGATTIVVCIVYCLGIWLLVLDETDKKLVLSFQRG